MKNSKINFIAIIILFISLVFMFIGISYSIFNYFGNGMTNNVIQTGRVVFSYSDANGGTNGINIENAFSISDDMGKMLYGEGEYFDFSVSASTTSSDLGYEIVVNSSDDSTLNPKYVKIYLTTFEGLEEKELPLTNLNGEVATYESLQDTNNPVLSGKTVYYGTVKAGEIAYGKKFRLRMWVASPEEENFDYSLINDKFFSIKVNVAASSI